jgi:hypothetical protein
LENDFDSELEESYDVAISETFSPELISEFKTEARKCTKGRYMDGIYKTTIFLNYLDETYC